MSKKDKLQQWAERRGRADIDLDAEMAAIEAEFGLESSGEDPAGAADPAGGGEAESSSEDLPPPPPPAAPLSSSSSSSSSSEEEDELPPVASEEEEEEELQKKLKRVACVRCGAENKADYTQCSSCGLKNVEKQSEEEKKRTQEKLQRLEQSKGKLKPVPVRKEEKQKKEEEVKPKATTKKTPQQILDMSASDSSLASKLSRVECSRCGAENRGTAKACGSCGLKL